MTKPYTFIEALADMQRVMSDHSWWKRRCDHTPLANDLPVRGAMLMIEKMGPLKRALEQAQDCIRGETPEDCTPEEARADTLVKIREALGL